ncbi:MAG: hypothetical protein Q8R32_00775, partial [bacterium]|nr:hypothetical protein [bacterium]
TAHCPLPTASSSGFTLLGVLIASFFVVLVVAALAGIARNTIRAARATEDRFIATLLAREGIEFVRVVRDNNWLAEVPCGPPLGDDCNDFRINWRGPSSEYGQPGNICNSDNRVVFKVDPVALGQTTTLQRVGNLMTDTILNLTTDVNDYYYTHQNIGRPTKFRRWVIISTPPPGDCGEYSRLVPGNPAQSVRPNPFTVRVIVAWDTGGDENCTPGRRCVELREDLYPWLNFR